MQSFLKRRVVWLCSLLVVALVAVPLAVFADVINPDGDSITTNGNQTTINLGSSVAPGTTLTPQVSFQLVCSGGNHHVDDPQFVNLAYDAGASTVSFNGGPATPAGSALNATLATIGATTGSDLGIPTAWPNDGSNCTGTPGPQDDNNNSGVTITAPTTPGSYSFVVAYTVSLSPSGTGDTSAITGSAPRVTYNFTVVGKQNQTITFGPLANKTYGDADFNVSATASSGLAVTFTASGNCTIPSGNTVHIISAGSCTVTASQVGNGSYNAAPDVSQSFNIAKADATCSISGYSGVYDANAHGATGSCSGISGESAGTLNLGATFTDVPGGTANWTFTGNGNYEDESGSVNIVITQADANVVVTGYTGVYDANAHGTTGSATGIGGVDLSAGLDLGDSFTDVPGGTTNWTFEGGTNYQDESGSVDIVITQADANVVVTGYTGVYDANAHGATGSATGVGGVDLSAGLALGATFTDVPGGTANWTFEGGTNYQDENGSVNIVITQADAAVTVTGYTGVYDAAAHGATGSATGVGGADLSTGLNLGATFTNAPGGIANWTFEGGTNYQDESGSVNIIISKASSNVIVICTPTSFYFTGSPITPCTATVTGVGGLNQSLTVIYTNNTAVGTATANASYAGDANHEGSSNSANFTIRAFSFLGFYAPVDKGIHNTVKGGATVPLKFEIFVDNVEVTSVANVKMSVTQVGCTVTSTDDVEITTTEATSLRYDSVGGQFIFNWKTPKLSGRCYLATATYDNGPTISALFQLK